MKWGFASTAAIVRCLQKDLYYRNELENDLRLLSLDNLNVKWAMKVDDWLPVIADLLYYGMLTGSGRRTLGEAYSGILPVDLIQRKGILQDRMKRIVWLLGSILLPFYLKKRFRSANEFIDPLTTILFYSSGKFPSIINRLLSIRYIFYPRKAPTLDEDAALYKGLAFATAIITTIKLSDALKEFRQSKRQVGSAGCHGMKPSKTPHKCPVCFDVIIDVCFANTKCGHVYCWYCISKWLSMSLQNQQLADAKSSCPVCRIPCEPPDLLAIANVF